MIPREISEAARILADEICAYCETQADTWRLIPKLALWADGRSGYDDNLARAYHDRKWVLECSVADGRYWMYVDLSTGKLSYTVNNEGPYVDMSVRCRAVLKLAFCMEQIDAAVIARALVEQAQHKTTCAPHSAGPDWREKLKVELGLV